MSRLIQLIDDYKDAHGQPSDASIARSIGIAPASLSSWRKRGLRDLPSPDTLRRLANFIHLDYESVVLRAVLVDIGVIIEDGTQPPPPPASMPRSANEPA